MASQQSILRNLRILLRTEQVEEALEKALTEPVSQGRWWNSRGLLFFEESLYKEALQVWEKGASQAPENPALPVFLALVHLELDQLTQAHQQLELVEKKTPTNQVLSTLWFFYHLKKGELDLAYQKVGLHPTDQPQIKPHQKLTASNLYLTSIITWLQKQSNPVIPTQELIELEVLTDPPTPPKKKVPLASKAKAKFLNRKVDKLVVELDELQLTKKNSQKIINKLNKAIKISHEVVELDPSLLHSAMQFALFKIHLALTYLEIEKKEEAKKNAQEAYDALLLSWHYDGASFMIFYYISVTHQIQNSLASAKHYMERALGLFKKLPEAYWCLGEIALSLGDEAEAKRQFNTAIHHEASLVKDYIETYWINNHSQLS